MPPKQATTIDHISNGRFALNLVMGWFTPEMEMFQGTQRAHDDRYRYGAEWLTVVKRLWTDEAPFDFETADFHIKQAQAHPKPIQKPYPVLINAGHSPAARDFSAREVDFSFVGFDSVEAVRAVAAQVREMARTDYQRDIGVCTSALVVCRETEAEARQVYRSIIEQGDRVAADNLMKVLGIESQSFNERIESIASASSRAGAPIPSSARPSRSPPSSPRSRRPGSTAWCSASSTTTRSSNISTAR